MWEGGLRLSTFIFWIFPNLVKYTYRWLPLEQHHKIGKKTNHSLEPLDYWSAFHFKRTFALYMGNFKSYTLQLIWVLSFLQRQMHLSISLRPCPPTPPIWASTSIYCI
jgi:hypothetical protein